MARGHGLSRQVVRAAWVSRDARIRVCVHDSPSPVPSALGVSQGQDSRPDTLHSSRLES